VNARQGPRGASIDGKVKAARLPGTGVCGGEAFTSPPTPQGCPPPPPPAPLRGNELLQAARTRAAAAEADSVARCGAEVELFGDNWAEGSNSVPAVPVYMSLTQGALHGMQPTAVVSTKLHWVTIAAHDAAGTWSPKTPRGFSKDI
jgi:hypothetical protein